MKFIPALLLTGSLMMTLPAFGQDPKRFEKEIQAYTTADATNPPPKDAILFIGSSTFHFWKTLAADFPTHKVFNRGFGGSQMSDALYYFDKIVAPYHPRLIVLYEGSNDINDRKSPEQVFDDFKTFVAKMHEALPDSKLAYVSILTTPIRSAQIDKVKAANKLIREYIDHDDKLVFIDAFPSVLGPDGKADPKYFIADRLHPNANGYAVLKKAIEPYLSKY
jgi:lysophospholipase L1-like esterase